MPKFLEIKKIFDIHWITR